MAYDNKGNNKGYGNKPYNNKNEESPKLPIGYLEGGYYTKKNDELVLKKEYIVEFPKEIAEALSLDRNKNKRSQIRKFYEYTLRIQDLLRRKNGDFSIVEAELNRLIPYVTYANSRATVTQLFEDFIRKNVKNIQSEKDLVAFVKHFEAIVAYLPKEKN